MPAPRVSWPTIKARSSQEDAPFLFVLPDGGRFLLLAIVEWFRWEATYRLDNYDFSDWDELQAIVEATIAGLLEGVPMHDLIVSTNAISQAIADCCALIDAALTGLANVIPATVQPGAPGGGLDPATDPPPSSHPTWTDFHCAAGHALADEMAAKFRELDALAQNGALSIGAVLLILGTLLAIFLTGGSALVAIVAALSEGVAFWGALQLLSSSALLGIANTFETDANLRNELGCALNDATSGTDAKALVDVVYESYFTGPELSAVKLGTIKGTVDVFWKAGNGDGQIDLSAYTGITCGCSPACMKDYAGYPTITGNLCYVPVTLTDVQIAEINTSQVVLDAWTQGMPIDIRGTVGNGTSFLGVWVSAVQPANAKGLVFNMTCDTLQGDKSAIRRIIGAKNENGVTTTNVKAQGFGNIIIYKSTNPDAATLSASFGNVYTTFQEMAGAAQGALGYEHGTGGSSEFINITISNLAWLVEPT